MSTKAKANTEDRGDAAIQIEDYDIDLGIIDATILGVTPLMPHNKGPGAVRELLKPAKKKNQAERDSTLKHNPDREFRESCYYRDTDTGGPTTLMFPASAFKRSMQTAAKHIPGVFMTEVRELVTVEGTLVDLYGTPFLRMGSVVQSGRNPIPDIRTWPILPAWCCDITIRFVQPRMSATAVMKLLSTAGLICGVGDGRPEKGAFDFGRFEVVDPKDERVEELRKAGGAAAQDEALAKPVPFDNFSRENYEWFHGELDKLDEPARKKLLAA